MIIAKAAGSMARPAEKYDPILFIAKVYYLIIALKFVGRALFYPKSFIMIVSRVTAFAGNGFFLYAVHRL